MEDSTPEEQCADPDTPVVLVPDQLAELADMQPATPVNEVLPVSSDNPVDLILNANCPLSERLRELRLETRGYMQLFYSS